MPANPTNSPSSEFPCEPLVAGQLAREAISVAEKVHRTFLRSVEKDVAELLREPITLTFDGTIQAPFSSSLNSTLSGDRAIELDLSPLQGSGFLIFPASLLFQVLDILMASPSAALPETATDQARSVTAIEMYILREFFELFARSLREAWAPIYVAAFTQVPPSDDPGSGLAKAGDEIALVLRSSMELKGAFSEIRLMLPTFLPRMAQMKAADETAGKRGRGEPAASILQCLSGASVDLEAVMGGATIRIRDLLAMTPGQILMTGASEDESFECRVNGREQFTGSLVAIGGKCGMRIDSVTTGNQPSAASPSER
jgi:flagellar motor switch protein FliM